jgi:hypothetical protein
LEKKKDQSQGIGFHMPEIQIGLYIADKSEEKW